MARSELAPETPGAGLGSSPARRKPRRPSGAGRSGAAARRAADRPSRDGLRSDRARVDRARVDRAGHVVDRVLAVLCAAAILAAIASLGREPHARGYTEIDTRRTRLDPPWGWVDPRWHELVAHRMAGLGPLDSEEPEHREAVMRELADVPFIVEVGKATTLWPDGLRVPVRFADVVACARIGRWFQPVSVDGTVLPGRWPSPPPAGAGFLPVIGPVGVAPSDLRAGDHLPGRAARAGLSIATSMWEHLDDDTIERLGRVVVDASRADETSPAEPGARLLLEGGREVLFGRSPDLDEPGELPVGSKWSSLSKALRLGDADASGPDSFDWGVCDLRWDRAELSPRTAAESSHP